LKAAPCQIAGYWNEYAFQLELPSWAIAVSLSVPNWCQWFSNPAQSSKALSSTFFSALTDCNHFAFPRQ
jgi:hypothetical protein